MQANEATATGYRPGVIWNLGLAAYWFASSYKWFILLVSVLPAQVAAMAPEGEKNTQWGWVVQIGAIWAIFGPALFGHWSDRIAVRLGTRKQFIAIGAALTVIALMVLMGANSLVVMILGYLLLQVSDDVGTGPYGALIPEIVPRERRGRASGFMGLMTVSAQVSSAVIAIALGDIQKIYIAIAAINVLCAVAVMVTLRGVRARPVAAKPMSFVEGWLKPWRSADFRWVWFTRFLCSLGFYIVQLYLRNNLEDRFTSYAFFGLEAKDATQAVQYLGLLVSCFGIVGALWAMRVTDRIGRKRVVMTAGLVSACALVPFALIPSFPLVVVLTLVFGMGYGAYQSADWALASDVLPSEGEYGKDMGVWTSSVTSVQVLAGGAGMAIDALNRVSPGSGYVIAILSGAMMFAAGSMLVRRIQGTT